jgi:hypothetical protein
LIVASLVVAALLTSGDSRVWWVAGGVCAATGLPQDHDDVGNWLEPLGMAALFVEGSVVLLASTVTALTRRTVTHIDIREATLPGKARRPVRA